jgi:transcriptional regulator with XRE-family HTH domain
MTFDKLDAEIREQIRQRPRGFQAELAGKLGVTRQYVSHVASGRSPISRDHYQAILDALGLEVVIRPKQKP